MSHRIDVEVVHEVDDEVVAAFGRLLPQLSQSARPVDVRALPRTGCTCASAFSQAIPRCSAGLMAPREHVLR